MTTNIPVQGAWIVGALTPPWPDHQFGRGRCIVRAADDVLYEIDGYADDYAFHGSPLLRGDWDDLVACEEVTVLPEQMPLGAHADLWVFRGCPRQNGALMDLQRSDALVHPPVVNGATTLCIVRRGAVARSLLRKWQDAAVEAAMDQVEISAWDRAVAETEFAVGLGFEPSSMALMVLLYRRVGRVQRADGYLVMAERSRGTDFAREVTREMTRWREEIFRRCYRIHAAGGCIRSREDMLNACTRGSMLREVLKVPRKTIGALLDDHEFMRGYKGCVPTYVVHSIVDWFASHEVCDWPKAKDV